MPDDYEKLGNEINRSLSPLFLELGRKIKSYTDQKPIINVNTPDVKVPAIKIPTINVPPVKIPEINIPPFDIPKIPEPKVTVNVDKVKISNLDEFPQWEMDYEKITKPLIDELKNLSRGGGAGQSEYMSGGAYSALAGVSGPAVMWEDTSRVMRTASAAKPFPVNVVAGSITLTGADGAILDGVNPLIKGTVFDLTNSNPIATQIVDATGDAITSFGGGTQYTEADTDASITGTAVMWEDGSDTLRAVSVALPFPVQLPAATVTTLTPPAAITGFATSAKQLPDGHSVALSATDNAVIDDIAANQTDASQKTQLVDGVGNVISATSNALDINIKSGNITGFATSAKQLADGHNVNVNNAGGASAVNIQDGGNTITIDGTITANLSATDNSVLDDIATSLAIIDDWDASDHCNIRHLNATDDVLVANLSATDNAVLDTIDDVLDTINAKLVTGTDIGDVTVNNAVGSAVYVQPGTGASWAVTNADITSSKTALELLDNSVDGNYLNVNCNIAGTDFVGGAGAVATGVQRTTLASDDPAVTSLAIIDDWDSGDTCKVTAQAGTAAIGKLLPPDVDVTTNSNYAKKYYTSAGAVTDGIIWSPAAGKRWHIHTITINVSAAATVTLEDDLAGGDSAIYKAEFAANSGVVLTFPEKYPWASSEDASDLIVTTSAGNIYITVSGIEI